MNEILITRSAGLRYRNDGPLVVSDVDLVVSTGSALGIVGESGSGKTSLSRLLVGVLPPTEGEVLIDGAPWHTVKRRDQNRRRVQMVFQDPYGSLNPWMPVRDAVAEPIQYWQGITRRAARDKASELLAETGLSEDFIDRRPTELSGGQCQRAGIARALACDPDVLVADEPTSSLDVSVQAQILNLLVTLRQQRGLALVLVSHDLSVIRYATDDAIVMYGGKVVEHGPTKELLAAPRHPYTRILVDSIPGKEGGMHMAPATPQPGHWCVFASLCPNLQADCVDRPVSFKNAARGAACAHPLPDQALNHEAATRLQSTHVGRSSAFGIGQ